MNDLVENKPDNDLVEKKLDRDLTWNSARERIPGMTPSLREILKAIDNAHLAGYTIHYDAVADACAVANTMLSYVKKLTLQQLKHADCGEHDLDVEYAKLITFCNQGRGLASTFELNLRDRENNAKHRVNLSLNKNCLLYTSPSPRDRQKSRMPSSA